MLYLHFVKLHSMRNEICGRENSTKLQIKIKKKSKKKNTNIHTYTHENNKIRTICTILSHAHELRRRMKEHALNSRYTESTEEEEEKEEEKTIKTNYKWKHSRYTNQSMYWIR